MNRKTFSGKICKYLGFLFVSVIAMAPGCKKSSNQKITPDVSNFSAIGLSNYTVGTTGTILVTSSSLKDGNYTVKFTYRGYYDTINSPVQSAVLNIANHSGTFQTPVLSAVPVTYVTIDSIVNTYGNGAAPKSNNVVVLTDSTGYIEVTFSNSTSMGFTVVSTDTGSIFYTDTTFTEIASFNLAIGGAYYYPKGSAIDEKDVVIMISNFSPYMPESYTISNEWDGGSAAIYTYNPRNYTIDTARYGTITITAISPVLTGNFSFTFLDSTKVNGTFKYKS